MATTRQKTAARRNIKKAVSVSAARRRKGAAPKRGNAVARFNQVEGVSQAERNAAWRRIKSAAKKYGIEIRAEKPGSRSR
ncbi:MAG: hypothetical protein E6J08_13830 [Chloroflexi bacterium]|nr:MAG: hypothetical protein E6J08_13830 [Chloroflexota bacterium]